MLNLKIHSIESMGTLDGPGVRTVVFLTGCPLRCKYCHNPDTWTHEFSKEITSEEIVKKILRFKPYFKKNGGVTFSGGESLLQAKALIPIVRELKKNDIHVVIDTSGAIINDDVIELLGLVDLVLLDVKHTDSQAYHDLTEGKLYTTLSFLNLLIEKKKPYWIRQVIIEGITDNPDQIKRLDEITKSEYREKLELLPFHKHGTHKWEAIGKEFELKDYPETSDKTIERLTRYIR